MNTQDLKIMAINQLSFREAACAPTSRTIVLSILHSPSFQLGISLLLFHSFSIAFILGTLTIASLHRPLLQISPLEG
ncbi:hypothetical protein FOBRF1_010544 [Fusarium oxysporum]